MDIKKLIDGKRDLDIFSKIKNLGNKRLSNNDKVIVKLIKTQLEGNWRKYLI